MEILKRHNDIQKIFLDSLDSDYGLPVIPENIWKSLLSNYGKDFVRDQLVLCIEKFKPAFPLTNISKEEMRALFYKFLRDDLKNDLIEKNETLIIREKFNDYLYNWKNSGIAVIDTGSQYNGVSDYFMKQERFKCPSYGYDSPINRWNRRENLKSLLGPLFRMGKKLSIREYAICLRLGGYIATQFKPTVAKIFYGRFQAKKILDISCGWGDRLAAFYCSPTTKYYFGFDPNISLLPIYLKQCIEYEKLLGCNDPEIIQQKDMILVSGIKKTLIRGIAAEDYSWMNPIDDDFNNFDLVFSSPPYFATELYNKDGMNVENQSWKRYSTYELWRDKFLFPVLLGCFKNLSPTGSIIINIMDPKVKNNRYYIGEELVHYMQSIGIDFEGLIGMRIKQRPKSLQTFENGREGFNDYMKEIYIEPCYWFSQKNSIIHKNSLIPKLNTLESFI